MALVVSLVIVFNINTTILERSYTAFDGNPDAVGLKGVAGDVHNAGTAAAGGGSSFYSASTNMNKLLHNQLDSHGVQVRGDRAVSRKTGIRVITEGFDCPKSARFAVGLNFQHCHP